MLNNVCSLAYGGACSIADDNVSVLATLYPETVLPSVYVGPMECMNGRRRREMKGEREREGAMWHC